MDVDKVIASERFKKCRDGFPAELYERYTMGRPRNETERAAFVHEARSRARRFSDSDNARNIRSIFEHCRIEPDTSRRYFYNIDAFLSYKTYERVVLNSTPDWKTIIERPLTDLYVSADAAADEAQRTFASRNNATVDAMLAYLDRCIRYVERSDFANKDQIVVWLSSLKTRGAESFEEALQRLLFVNQLFWQTPHNLIGLGRVDKLLDERYRADIESGALTREGAREAIGEFLRVLHRYYWYKSGALMGDTGQICIVGGKEPDGSYFSNDLTYLFIEVVKELQQPDPKVLLRVDDDVPADLVSLALDCIQTGIGCPLISNDEQVIPAMIAFGYAPEDSYDYVTSSCWEPLVAGIAHEQNNIADIHFLLPLFWLSQDGQMDEEKLPSFDALVEGYLQNLSRLCGYIGDDLDKLSWDDDPLYSAFTAPCRASLTDVARGGGAYANFGVLSLGMANLVNSLYNIKRYVYDAHRFTLAELDGYRKENFEGHEAVLDLLANTPKSFGRDDPEVIALVRRIMDTVETSFSAYRNRFGGKVKCGLSAPGYIMGSLYTEASFDGRLYGTPYATHISCDDPLPYTELMSFASKLDYSGIRFNGNVVDFFCTPNLMKDNHDQFVSLIMTSFKMGVFQIQVNVVSAATLIDAKAHPENYPGLIVRVWGFSAYFIDLPENYQDDLIARALINERAA